MSKKSNSNMHAAKAAKNDEFYTRFQDILSELNAYHAYDKDVFKGKRILLPCDDPSVSNFTEVFRQLRSKYKFKEVVSTCFSKGGLGTGSRIDSKGNEHYFTLRGDGDFRSEEVTALKDKADIIITNPPFSLFREFIVWVNPKVKGCVTMSNMNAVTYKEVFPLIKDNHLWAGSVFNKSLYFFVPEGFVYSDKYKGERTADGKPACLVPAICWFTNLKHRRRYESKSTITMAQLKDYLGVEFAKYDNYDAIEVSKTSWIPSDYDGLMGVPISFLSVYCPTQFEIVGFWNAGEAGRVLGAAVTDTIIGGEIKQWNGPVVRKTPLYFRIIIKRIL